MARLHTGQEAQQIRDDLRAALIHTLTSTTADRARRRRARILLDVVTDELTYAIAVGERVDAVVDGALSTRSDASDAPSLLVVLSGRALVAAATAAGLRPRVHLVELPLDSTLIIEPDTPAADLPSPTFQITSGMSKISFRYPTTSTADIAERALLTNRVLAQ